MSLVGSLEDLGLGDILQIVSMSRKSGVLRLLSHDGEGRIVLQDGMVSGAAVKGDFEDVQELLLVDEHVTEAQLQEALSQAASSGCSLPDALSAAGLVSPERFDAICRLRVETAVMEMFDWREGEFTFEVREGMEVRDAVLLTTPLSIQYIAMEATRKRDEIAHFGDEPFDDEPVLFSGEGGTGDPVDGLAFGAVEQVEALEANHLPDGQARSATTEIAAVPRELHPLARVQQTPPAEAATAAERGHLIAIDSDLGALEWLKATVGELFERIHIFQRPEIGVERIRHYLARGLVPVVVVAAGANAERAGGAAELVARLRALASGMRIAVLFDEGREVCAGFEAADAVLYRPACPGSDPEKWIHYQDMADALLEGLMPLLAVPAQPAGGAPQVAPLLRLKQISGQLLDPPCDRDILGLALDFAAETFHRVALFMLRDDAFQAIAERGLARAGGPAPEELSRIAFRRDEAPQIFRTVLERGGPVVGSATRESDAWLALQLGRAAAPQVFVAPIQSGECVVALLYADNLPSGDPFPDTTPLEIALAQAGMALDRALLRRALAEACPSA